MIHSLFGRLSSIVHSSNNNSSIDIPQKGSSVVRCASIQPLPIGILQRESFIQHCLDSRSGLGSYPSRSGSLRVPNSNPILSTLLPPPKTITTAAPVVVLKEAPFCDPVEIAFKVLKREDRIIREILARERHRNLINVEPSRFVHRTHLIHPSKSFLPSPPIYKFNPLGLNQPNTSAFKYFLSQKSLGERFHLYLVGIVFVQYLPSLLIGYYAWYAFLGPYVGIEGLKLLEWLNPFTTPGASTSGVVEQIGASTSGVVEQIGASNSGVVDGKRAAEVLQKRLEELLSNDEAAGAAAGEEDRKANLALFVSSFLLASAIVTFPFFFEKDSTLSHDD